MFDQFFVPSVNEWRLAIVSLCLFIFAHKYWRQFFYMLTDISTFGRFKFEIRYKNFLSSVIFYYFILRKKSFVWIFLFALLQILYSGFPLACKVLCQFFISREQNFDFLSVANILSNIVGLVSFGLAWLDFRKTVNDSGVFKFCYDVSSDKEDKEDKESVILNAEATPISIEHHANSIIKICQKKEIDFVNFQIEYSNILNSTQHFKFVRNEIHVMEQIDSNSYDYHLRIQYFNDKRTKNKNAFKVFTNERKISLQRIGLFHGTIQAEIKKTDYYTSEITNKANRLWFRKLGYPKKREFYDESYISIDDSGHWEFKELSECQTLSNHIGGVVLAISQDGVPLVSMQGKSNNEQAGKVVLTGCGSVDWKDLNHVKDNNLLDAIKYAQTRELFEETGFIAQNSILFEDHEKIIQYRNLMRTAGFYRPLSWSGLPIAIGFMRHPLNFSEILAAQKSRKGFFSPQEADTIDLRKIAEFTNIRVETPKKMINFLRRLPDCKEKMNEMNVKKFSLQIEIIAKALEYPEYAKHFEIAMRRAQ